jgi:hypothetical protein
LFFTSYVKTIFPEELEKQAPATSSRRRGLFLLDEMWPQLQAEWQTSRKERPDETSRLALSMGFEQ